MSKLNVDTATLIGEGEWVKDSAYRVYEQDGKYYATIVVGHSNLEILDDMTIEIKEEDIEKYI